MNLKASFPGLARTLLALIGGLLGLGTTASVRADDRLVGVWDLDEGFQRLELTLRSDGRYQLDTRSNDPNLDFAFSEPGRYQSGGTTLTLEPYEFFGEPTGRPYLLHLEGDTLTLTREEFSIVQVYIRRPGSREQVLVAEDVARDLVGTWRRHVDLVGTYEYTFRPGGYYFLKRIPLDSQFPIEWIRGRYLTDGPKLTLQPYSGVEQVLEADFFGSTLTLIRRGEFSGEATATELVSGSRAEVRARAAAADEFLGRDGWQVGVWEIREPFLRADVTFRPDGHYAVTNTTEFLEGSILGRYALSTASRQITLSPYSGQDIYARSNGEFGKVDRTRVLDYYDGELQFIDLGALSQTVYLARKRPDSEGPVRARTTAAQAERAVEGWQLGVWQVQDPVGALQFTFRPDGRYIATVGASHSERGRYLVNGGKLTLAPYLGLGAARGFEIDLYDGQLVLAGDLRRLVLARKIAGSEVEVVERTLHPVALNGERGPLLGRWTAHLPGQRTELVLRDDGEFRLDRCSGGSATRDYGRYTVDAATRTAWVDSRFAAAAELGLDVYGSTLTLHGAGFGSPTTWTVNLGTVEADFAASRAADGERAAVDAQWRDRVPVGPTVPGAGSGGGGLPDDPQPGRVFPSPTVFPQYRLYRRLIPGWVYFNVLGTIKGVPVVNTREWHFFGNGRVLVRFRNYFAGPVHPVTLEDISDTWGAYRIEPRPPGEDVTQRYADNAVIVETDSGDTAAMTLEDGRRHLFWEKDYMILSEWAAEQKPVPCEVPAGGDGSLANAAVDLTTSLAPDPIPEETAQPMLRGLALRGGGWVLSGHANAAGTWVVQRSTGAGPAWSWEPCQTNAIAAGAFEVVLPPGPEGAAFFRLRRQ